MSLCGASEARDLRVRSECLVGGLMSGAGHTGNSSDFRVVLPPSLWDVPMAIILGALGCAWCWVTGRLLSGAVILVTLTAVVSLKVSRPPVVVASTDKVRKRRLLGWTSCSRQELKAIEASVHWAATKPVEENPVITYTFRLKDGGSGFELTFGSTNTDAFRQLNRDVMELSKFLGIPIVDTVGGNYDRHRHAD